MSQHIVIASGTAEIYGRFKRLVIGRPAAVKGTKRQRRILRVDVVLEGCDEDIERDLLAFQQAVCRADEA